MNGFRSIKLPDPPTEEQLSLFQAFSHELSVLHAFSYPPNFGDVFDMDSRRQREARDVAKDITQIRIAHLIASLEIAGAEVSR